MKLDELITGEEGEAGTARYIIRDAAYALMPQPEISWVVNNLISEGSFTIVYGDPSAKKTYSMISLAVCCALGKDWIGMGTGKCRVLFVDEESGERRFTRRLGDAIRGEIGDDKTEFYYVCLAGFLLDDNSSAKELETIIHEHNIKLVVIDALVDVMREDENAAKDFRPVGRNLRRIAERTGAAMVLIHHANKLGSIRGSSSIKAAADLVIKAESEPDSRFINFKTEKTRDIEGKKFSAIATWTDNQFYLEPFEKQEKGEHLNKSQSYVIRYLTENGESSLPDIMGAADSCSSESAKRAVYSLVDMGKLRRTNPEDTGRGAIAKYDLVKGSANDDE